MTAMELAAVRPESIVGDAEAAAAKLAEARRAVADVIFGQETVVERALTTVLSGGHGLLVGVPGLAKTKLVDTMSTVLGLSAGRIQFTPDLMPSDILGSEILEEGPDRTRSFRFVRGPVFAQLLMADEINRASPRTQSALLQAMQEHHVTIAGQRHDLPRPFPRARHPEPDRAGGHLSPPRGAARPVPDADRRALSRSRCGTPHAVRDHRGGGGAAEGVLNGQELMRIQGLVRRMPVGESLSRRS
jgi:MoxR-like ATPase